MKELLWFFPDSIEQVKNLIINEEGITLHSGGTGLLRGNIRRYKGLLDMGRLSMNFIEEKGAFYEIGATSTYNNVVKYFDTKAKNSILYKSLLNSATTPLRNRITIGGSVAYFPYWSDIMGPFLAVDAELYLTGAKEGWFKILDYVSSRELHKKTAILKVRFSKQNDTGFSYHYRAIRTKVDHPAFTITLNMNIKQGIVDRASLWVIGTKDKFKKLTLAESQIIGKEAKSINTKSIKIDAVEFFGKVQQSAEYQRLLFEVELKRGLKKILESV